MSRPIRAPRALALAVLVLASPAAHATTTNEEGLSTVRYDLSLLRSLPVDEPRELFLLPYRPVPVHADETEHEDLGDVLVELLGDVLAPDEFLYEGRRLDILDDGRLLVRAPDALHARVTGLLDGLAARFGRRAVVRVDVLRASGTGLEPGQLVRSSRVEIPWGRVVSREALVAETLVRRWEGDVANSATVITPVVEEVTTGMRLVLRIEKAPGRDGHRLRWFVHLSELTDHGTRRVDQPGLLVLDDQIVHDDGRRLLDLPTIALAAGAGSRVVAPGESISQTLWTATHAGQTGYLVRVVLEAVEPAPEPMATGDVRVAVVDVSHLSWGGVDSPRPLARRMRGSDGTELEGYLDHDVELARFPSAALRDEWPESERVQAASWEHGGYVAWIAPWMIVAGPSAFVDPAQATLSLATGPDRPLVVEVELAPAGVGAAARRTRGDAGGGALVRLALETGRPAFALVGDVVSHVRGYRNGIATSSGQTTVQVADSVDGLWVRARADASGAVDLDVAVNRLVDLDRRDLGRDGDGDLESPRFLAADLTGRVPADGGQVVLGTIGGLGDDALLVRARVVP